jgi:urease accessory protein
VFRRSGRKTVLAAAFAASPLRFFTPRNHGAAAWVFLGNLGGGLVDGDRVDLAIEAEPETAAFIGTQASTKVYRSSRGCSQRLAVRAADASLLVIAPDPVVCFAGARYRQDIDMALSSTASIVLVDGYTSGRAACGERWKFARFESRTTIARDGVGAIVDATRLDPIHGAIAPRMGSFDVVLSVVVAGPRLRAVREAMLEERSAGGALVVAPSPIGGDAAIVRVAADSFESASRALRRSFRALAETLGDDPFARKW